MFLRQPNSWSCLPTAFANVTNIHHDYIILKIGHDGSEIIYPNQLDPHGRKAFNDFELINAMVQFDQYFMPFAPRYETSKGLVNLGDTLEVDNVDFVKKIIERFNGVMVGDFGMNYGHAVSWIDGRIVDPKGSEYPLENLDKVDMFWAWTNRPRIRF